MRGVPVSVCMSCGHRSFPERLLCPRCGGGDRRREWVEAGTVEEATLLRRAAGRAYEEPVVLASVRLSAGPRVIARLEERLPPRTSVSLDLRDGAPVARRSS